jgi:hypothetical protein
LRLVQNTPLHPIIEWSRQRFVGIDVPAERLLADLDTSPDVSTACVPVEAIDEFVAALNVDVDCRAERSRRRENDQHEIPSDRAVPFAMTETDGGLDALVGVGDHQLDAAKPAAGELAMPRTSRRPSPLTPTAMITATDTMRPLWRTFSRSRRSTDRGQSPSSARLKKAFTFSSISSHSRLTWLLEMPVRLRASGYSPGQRTCPFRS